MSFLNRTACVFEKRPHWSNVARKKVTFLFVQRIYVSTNIHLIHLQHFSMKLLKHRVARLRVKREFKDGFLATKKKHAKD